MEVKKFKVLLHLKKKRLDRSGKTPIMGRITVNESIAQFSCKLSCTQALWNPCSSRLKGKSREAIEANTRIEKLLLDIHSAFDTLMEYNKPFDAVMVRDLFQGKMETQMTLLKLFDQHIDRIRKRIGIDRAPTTLNTYVYTHRSLSNFIKKKFKAKDVAFGQLNEQFIREYQDFAVNELGYSVQTVRHYLAILKKICNIAFKEGYTKRHYFLHFKLPKQKTSVPQSLSRENFEKLRDLKIRENLHSHILTKDLFLFACYTGTSYVDTISITKENLVSDIEGSLWLKYRRRKTKLLACVKLLPEAITLIEKYKDELRDTLFPMQRYDILRANMKGLAVMADLTQNLVYHLGRQTFASLILLKEGVPMETISLMLGHDDLRTTQIYAHVTPKKLFEDMDKFIEATKDLKLVL